MRGKHLSFLAVLAVAALVAAVFAVQGCSTSSRSGAAAAASSADTSSTDNQSQQADQGEPTYPGEEPLHTSDVKVTGGEIAVMKTSRGVVKFKFYPKDAPNTVASFIELVRKGFYDGTLFHRVVPGFVVQGGDPLTKDPNADPRMYGTGGPGYRLKAEFNDQRHLEGTVAMARSQDPDSAGSQFYICLAPQPSLDRQYTVFGQVIDGMDVVKNIQQGDKLESISIESGE